jgi:hypothetical protein
MGIAIDLLLIRHIECLDRLMLEKNIVQQFADQDLILLLLAKRGFIGIVSTCWV